MPGSEATSLPMNPPAHIISVFCADAPVTTHIHFSTVSQHPPAHMFDHSGRILPVSTHFEPYTQNCYPSAHTPVPVASQLSFTGTICRYFHPASTHIFLFIMHVRYPPAHIIATQDVTYTLQHTLSIGLIRLSPVSAHIFRFLSVETAAVYFSAESGAIPPTHISSWLVKTQFAQPRSCCVGLVMSAVTMPIKVRMLFIQPAHVQKRGSPSVHTFVYYISIYPLAHMFPEENKISFQHTSLSGRLTKAVNKHQKTLQVLKHIYGRIVYPEQIHQT